MKAIALAAVLFVTTGCVTTIVDPVIPPQPQGSTCESSNANLEKLGGCGIDMATFVQNCHDREKFDASRGRTLPLDCIASAATCEVARSCTF